MSTFRKYVQLNAILCSLISAGAYASVPIPADGTKSQAMGGVSVAIPLDTFVMAANPAGIAFLDDRFDVNLTYIRPDDDIEIKNNALIRKKRTFNSSPDFFVPLGGIKKDFSCLSFGLCTFGRGAAVNYGTSIPIYGTSKFRLNYLQLIVKPCVAWKINENHSIGFGVNLAMSQFKNEGAQRLKAISSDPTHLTNKGFDYRPGIGFHIGWVGKFFERLKLGIALESQIFNHRFKKYRGLIPEHGKANGPSIVTAGFSYDFPCRLTVAFDYQKIFWQPLRAFSNKLTFEELLGNNDGSGQGWRNEERYKVGMAYQVNENLTFRLGYQYQRPVFSSDQLYNNVNAATNFPSKYICGGISWASGCNEINIAYMQSLRDTMNGVLPLAVGGGNIKARTLNQIVGISWGRQF
jgi:long-chain fatty acid transport protein